MKKFAPHFLYLTVLVLADARYPADQDIPTIPLHVALIAEQTEAGEAFTPEAIQWIADSLNQEFHSGEGVQLARFSVKQVTQVDEVRRISPEYFAIGETKDFRAMKTDAYTKPIFRKDAFNVFIYFNKHGTNRSNGGFLYLRKRINGKLQTDYYARILFDWKALKQRDAKLLLHEMGHAFGLGHVKPIEGSEDSRNIMTAKEDAPVTLPPGESGYYFTPSQAAIVSKSAAGMVETFKRASNGEPLAEPK